MKYITFLCILVFSGSAIAKDCSDIWESVSDIGGLADELDKLANDKIKTIVATPKALRIARTSIDPVLTLHQMSAMRFGEVEIVYSESCDTKLLSELVEQNRKHLFKYLGDLDDNFTIEYKEAPIGALIQSINAICHTKILVERDRLSKIWISKPDNNLYKLNCRDFATILAGLGIRLNLANSRLIATGPVETLSDYDLNIIRNKKYGIVFPREISNFSGYEFQSNKTKNLSYVEYLAGKKTGYLDMVISVNDIPKEESNILNKEIDRQLDLFKKRVRKKGSKVVACRNIELVSEENHYGNGYECEYNHLSEASNTLYEWALTMVLFEFEKRIIQFDAITPSENKFDNQKIIRDFIRSSIDFIAEKNKNQL